MQNVSLPRQLWSSIDALLGRGAIPPSDKIDAEQLQRYFDENVASVRSAIAGSPMPSFVKASADESFNCFQTVSLDEVVAAVKALPDKSCTLDHYQPNYSRLLYTDVISPFLTELFNRSQPFGHVPDAFK